jgi:hypothetical protein
MTCHEYFDTPIVPTTVITSQDRFAWKLEMSEDFLYCCIITLVNRVQQGILYTDDLKRET